MKVAVLSDSHDNVWKLDQAMPHLAAAEAVIHCGDLVAPFVVQRLGEGVGDTPVHIVLGNNEGDLFRIARVVDELPHVKFHGVLAEIELQGVMIAACHDPQVARGLARSGFYGMVCYGHTHAPHEEWIGDCLLLNPGELMALHGRSTIALVELPQRAVQWIEF